MEQIPRRHRQTFHGARRGRPDLPARLVAYVRRDGAHARRAPLHRDVDAVQRRLGGCGLQCGQRVFIEVVGDGDLRGKCGFLSGVVEPIGAFITILLTSKIIVILPYLLAFAAGAMIYVVIEELIPESQSGEHTNIGTIGAAIGFVLMMVLDVALG